MLGEEYYIPDGELREVAIACSNGLSYINGTPSRDPEREKFLKSFFGAYGEGNVIKDNFNCDYVILEKFYNKIYNSRNISWRNKSVFKKQ